MNEWYLEVLKLRGRIAELEAALIEAERDWEQERRNFRELEAKLDAVRGCKARDVSEVLMHWAESDTSYEWLYRPDVLAALQEHEDD